MVLFFLGGGGWRLEVSRGTANSQPHEDEDVLLEKEEDDEQ